jgi:UDP-glucose 4-epimerase
MTEIKPQLRIVVTGCAGFIGSNLVDFLLNTGHKVIGLDNLSTGNIENLEEALTQKEFNFHEVDLFENNNLDSYFKNTDLVFHFAANADVRYGAEHPRKDLEQNTLVTHNVLEAMRKNMVHKIVFSSTGSVYGEAPIIPTPEDSFFPVQTSLYGASKIAAESLIEAYCETFGIQAWIFRFVSILGPRYSHGHVYDFYEQLRSDPSYLKVLGNGHQKKSYLHVDDCIKAIDVALRNSNDKINIFNLGIDAVCEVRDSINWICQFLSIDPRIDFGSTAKGWIGDNPHIHLDITRIQKLGWEPSKSIEQGVKDTIRYLQKNEWLFEK